MGARASESTAGLPRNVYVDRGGNYSFRYRRKGIRIYQTLGKDREAALAKVERLTMRMAPKVGAMATFGGLPEQTLRALLYSSRSRAKQCGIEHKLTIEDIRGIAIRASGRCEVSGIPFNHASAGVRQRRPWAPSIDRIRADGAYAPANCRLVCVAVNLAMNEWGVEALTRIAIGLRICTDAEPAVT